MPEGCGEQGKMEKIGCKIICGAPSTLVVKGLMMMMMVMMMVMIMMIMMMIKAQTGNEWSSIVPKSSQARKKSQNHHF